MLTLRRPRSKIEGRKGPIPSSRQAPTSLRRRHAPLMTERCRARIRARFHVRSSQRRRFVHRGLAYRRLIEARRRPLLLHLLRASSQWRRSCAPPSPAAVAIVARSPVLSPSDKSRQSKISARTTFRDRLQGRGMSVGCEWSGRTAGSKGRGRRGHGASDGRTSTRSRPRGRTEMNAVEERRQEDQETERDGADDDDEL